MPIVELIAQAIETRLKAIRGTQLSSVYRPTQHDEETTRDSQAVLVEAATEVNEELSYPGNPPATAWDTTFEVRCQIADEDNTKSIDRRKQEIRADVHAAICNAGNNWYTFGGYAVDAVFLAPEVIQETGATTIKVPIRVTYRTSEYDLTVQR